eukprot:PhM_4_TR11470/c0_g1_i1/m.16170
MPPPSGIYPPTVSSASSLTPSRAHGASGARDDDRYALQLRIQQLEHELDCRRKTIAKLESDGLHHLRTLSDLKAEEDARRGQLQQQHKREVESDREKMRLLQAELNAEREKCSRLQQDKHRLDCDVMRLPAMESRVRELEQNLTSRSEELADQRRIKSDLEGKLLELQSSNAARVLEGKLGMMQTLLDERDQQLGEEQKRAHNLLSKMDDLKALLSESQTRITELERQKGEKDIFSEQRSKELERCQARVDCLEKETEVNLGRALELQHALDEKDVHHDTVLTDLRGELRSRARTISQLELEKQQLEDAADSLKKDISRAQADVERAEGESKRLQGELAAAITRVEQSDSLSAQDTVARRGLQEEVARLNSVIAERERELREAERMQFDVEGRLHSLEQDVRRKNALEEQVETLQISLDRREEDIKSELRLHAETKARLTELTEVAEQAQWCADQLRVAECDLAQMEEEVAKAEDRVAQAKANSEQLAGELEREAAKRVQVEARLGDVQDSNMQLQSRLAELESEALRSCSLEGQLDGLEAAIRQRQDEIEALTEQHNADIIRIRELEGYADEVAGYESRLNQAALERQRMQQLLDDADDQRRELEREAANATTQRRQREIELDTERSQCRELEDEVARLKQVELDHKLLQERVDELERECEEKNQSIDRARKTHEETEDTMRSAESRTARLTETVAELEGRLQLQAQLMDQRQVESGRQAVQLDELTKLKDKLLQDAEYRRTHVEQLEAAVERITSELTRSREDLSSSEQRNAELKRVVEDTEVRMEHAEERVRQVQATLEATKSRNSELEDRATELINQQHRLLMTDGKLSAMQSLVHEREEEAKRLSDTVAELKLRLAEADTERTAAVRLETKMKELRQQISRQASQLEELETECAERSSSLHEKEKALAARQNEIADLKSQLHEEHQRRVEMEANVHGLEIEIQQKGSLEGKVKGLEGLVADRTSELAAARDEAAALRQRVRVLERSQQTVSRLEDTVHELEAELEMKSHTIHRLQNDDSRRRDKMEEQRNGQLETDRMIATYHEEISRLRAANANLQTTLVEVQHENQARMRAMMSDASVSRDELSGNCAEVERLRARLLELEDGALQEQLRNAEDNCTRLSHTVADMEHEAGVQKVVVSGLQSEVEREKARVRELEDALQDTTGRLHCAQADARVNYDAAQSNEVGSRAQEQEINRLKYDLADARVQLDRLRSVESRNSQLETDVEHLAAELSMMRHQHEDAVSELRRRADDADAHARSSSSSIPRGSHTPHRADSISHERDMLRDQVSRLKQQLDTSNRDESERRRTYETTITSLTQKGQVADEAVDRLRELTKHVEDLRRENTRLRDENTSLTGEVMRQRSTAQRIMRQGSSAAPSLANISPQRRQYI